MPTSIHQLVRQAHKNELPNLLARLPSGWVLAGDRQWLKGYCMLVADPVVTDFNALNEEQRALYSIDMGRVGDALKECMGAYRINYETWCNLTPALHTHIVPRFKDEPEALRVLPPRQAYDWDQGRLFTLSEDQGWMAEIRRHLSRNL